MSKRKGSGKRLRRGDLGETFRIFERDVVGMARFVRRVWWSIVKGSDLSRFVWIGVSG